ncbi:MAG: hypothetical protein F6K58_11570 [Symploca sp. SIO2E9]|nr:hypothetical protein [Symploca sp. SIO2E9]
MKLLIISLVAPSLTLISATTLSAQTDVNVEPTQLTVAGTRDQVKTRNLFLRTTAPIRNFQLITMDLNRADGSAVFPAQAIIAQKTPTEPSKPNELTFLVQFDLQKVPSSGEFSGKLRLSYQDGEQSVPVTVRVKDHWLLPLIMLLVGTGLGVGASLYRTKGKPRDQIWMRVGQLRAQMQDDPDLIKAQPFQSRVEAQLLDVKMALQGERWQDSQKALEQAEMFWSKWNKGRSDWSIQLAYCHQLQQRLQDLNPNLPYVQDLHRRLENAVADVPDLDGPDKLRERLEEIAQQLNGFLQLQSKIQQLQSLCSQLSAQQASPWLSKKEELEQRLNNLLPSQLSEDKDFEDKLEEAIAAISKLVAENSAVAKGLPRLTVTPPSPLVAPAPPVHALKWEKQMNRAGLRLRVFNIASYCVAVFFLAGAGFSELYVDKTTFGANPWKDYFALLAWGFGAEASRDAIAKAMQSRGLPGFK